MRMSLSVRLRKERLSGRSIARRTAVLTAGAVCLGMTAVFWMPSAGADTTGTATLPVTGATRSVAVAVNAGLSECIHPDLQAANGLAMPGRCTAYVTVTNSGDEAVLKVSNGPATTSGDGSVSVCDNIPGGAACSGSPTSTAALFAYAAGLNTVLPGSGQFAVRVNHALAGGGFSTSGETLRSASLPPATCDVAFAGTGATYSGCKAGIVNQSTKEAVVLLGPSGGNAQLTSISVAWEVDPLQ